MHPIEIFFDRPIAFHRPLVSLGIGITGALMLSQAIYWSKRTDRESQGWFYKTAKEWEEETGMTTREQETARKHLREAGLISEDKRGIPCKLYYRVNMQAVYALLSSLVSTNPQNWLQQTCVSNTETTTETTTEIKTLVPSNDDTQKRKKKNDAPSEAFEQAWLIYPKRDGANPKATAWSAWKARVKAGVPEAELLAGTKRFKAYCEANRMIGTRFICMASVFYGTQERFREDYRINGAAQVSTDRSADRALADRELAARGIDVSKMTDEEINSAF